jgi:predicted nucleic acid-binding protein
MDLADASLVVAAEVLGIYSAMTLDSDFRVYRTRDGKAFDIFPETK